MEKKNTEQIFPNPFQQFCLLILNTLIVKR